MVIVVPRASNIRNTCQLIQGLETVSKLLTYPVLFIVFGKNVVEMYGLVVPRNLLECLFNNCIHGIESFLL